MLEYLLARRRLLLIALALAGAGALTAQPEWARAIGADVWNIPALKAQMRESSDNMARLDAADEEVLRRVAIKEGVVSDLIAGHITLTEAADQFAQLSAPRDLEILRVTTPGETDQEKFARNVLRYAALRLPGGERDEVMCRLEAEFQVILSGSAGG